MSRTAMFRRQHEELLSIASELSALLIPSALSKDAGPARKALSRLAGKLNVHLAMEDKSLYPHLLKSQDIKTQSTAKQFIEEMGNIAQVFKAYTQKWPHVAIIQDDPNGFIKETQGICEALGNRIDKENKVLYPLMEKT